MEKFRTDSLIQPHTFRDGLDIGSHALAEHSDLVDEGNLRGEKRVRSILDHFGCGNIRDHKRRFDEVQRSIEVLHHGYSTLADRADHDTVRPHKVFDGGTLSEKFRV